MTQTLEQARAADAWRCSEGRPRSYAILAKSVPALIMNSGLMQTVAFLEDKGGGSRDADHAVLNRQLRRWLAAQHPEVLPEAHFPAFMDALFKASPGQFQAITAEAVAWLRWVRQIAPTRATRTEG